MSTRLCAYPRSLFLLLVGCVLAPTLARGQSSSARPHVTVAGVVADGSGAVLPAATVDVLVAGQVVASATTGPDGRYRMRLVPDAQYQLRVRRAGFTDQVVELAWTSADVTHDVVMGMAAVADFVVVTPSRFLESRAATTESITVLTAREIEALGGRSLADVLRTVPGLQVESNGREGALASLFSRGGESDYNLVLVDGVRVNASGGQFDFSRIAAGEIDRVEVVRGAQSALYGSDAIGSVVHVFTRRAGALDSPTLSGSVEAGSFNTWRGDVRLLGGAHERADYHLDASYRGSDGAFSDILPEPDRYDQTTVNGGIGVLVGESATLRMGLRYSDARGRSVGPIVYGARDTGTVADSEDLSWHVDLSQRVTPRLHHTATLAYFRSDLFSADRIADPTYQVFAILAGRPGALYPESPRLVRQIDQATFDALRAGTRPLDAGQFLASTPFGVGDFPSTFESVFRRPAVEYQANLTWRDRQVLSVGYEYERETDPVNHFRVENHAYFVQQQLNIGNRWFASVGARVNDNSRYGTEVTPKFGAAGYLLPFTDGSVSSMKVFTNVGKGIKNPTFGELFGSAFTDGNPGLHPERARTVDAGAEVTFDRQRWLARATYFDNRYRDQVAFRSTGFSLDGLPDFLNVDGSQAHGWEFEAALQRPVAGVTASAGYALVDTKVVASISTSEQFQPGQPLLRRPKHSGSLRMTYVRNRAAVHADLRLVGQRHDAAFLRLVAVAAPQIPAGRLVDITLNPGYAVLGLGGDVVVRDGLTVFVRVDNVTNDRYESALGYPGMPRAAVVGARFVVGRR